MTGYALVDFGAGRRLERWGDVVLARPDSRADSPRVLAGQAWDQADAVFDGRIGVEGRIGQGGGETGGGGWQTRRPLPDRWPIVHGGLHFLVGLAPSGHTGLFPEQATHWTWMTEALRMAAAPSPAPEVLNLFAYTGGASIALAK